MKMVNYQLDQQRNESACPMECGFIACSNADCDFHTNCDLEVEEEQEI